MLVAACERALAAAGVERAGTERVLVACSGGPDSVALLRVAVVLLGPARVVAGHVDHRVRPGSREDAEHVARLAEQHGLEWLVTTLDPPSADEATLRALRYAALERMRVQAGAELVLLAHTRDDQAETVLLKLLRGAGLVGMPARNGRLLRPWLDVPRPKLRSYLEQKGWPFRDDPTNREPAFLRNRIRKELLPLLERRYAPGFARRLVQSAEPRTAPPAQPAAHRPSSAPRFEPHWIDRGVTVQRRSWSGEVPKDRATAVFDAGLVSAVRIRPPRPGDRICPFGRSLGRRKVSDVLSEARIPASVRGRWPIAVDEQGEVLWVAGLLRSNGAPVGPQTGDVWALTVERD